jgi:curved DNA-binding protein CbpA
MDDISKRFKFLCHAYHPDKFGSKQHKQSAEEEFKRIKAAYEFLKSQKRTSSEFNREEESAGKDRQPDNSVPHQAHSGASKAENKRSGWHRLWVAISCLWIAIVLFLGGVFYFDGLTEVSMDLEAYLSKDQSVTGIFLQCDYHNDWNKNASNEFMVIEFKKSDMPFHVWNRYVLCNVGKNEWERSQKLSLMENALDKATAKMEVDAVAAKRDAVIQFLLVILLCLVVPPFGLYGAGIVINWIFNGFSGR